MGRYRKKKHHHDRNKNSAESPSGQSQQKLNARSGARIKKSDFDDFLLPVLKEIGKCICPPAALPIEVLYQVYKHAGAVKAVTLAIIEGQYEKAAEIVVKEGAKEVAGAALESAMNPAVNQTSEAISERVKNCLPVNEQSKDVAGAIVEGATKGSAEAARDKIVRNVFDEVAKDEKQ